MVGDKTLLANREKEYDILKQLDTRQDVKVIGI